MSSKNSGVWPLGAAGAQAEHAKDASRAMAARAAFHFIGSSFLRRRKAIPSERYDCEEFLKTGLQTGDM